MFFSNSNSLSSMLKLHESTNNITKFKGAPKGVLCFPLRVMLDKHSLGMTYLSIVGTTFCLTIMADASLMEES